MHRRQLLGGIGTADNIGLAGYALPDTGLLDDHRDDSKHHHPWSDGASDSNDGAALTSLADVAADEGALVAGDQFRTESMMQRLAELHSNQISSMVAAQMGSAAND